ncbi:hypothetical protein [Sorangium sp. So ce131]|uniref:hypothetical protein n=1 Tax=Sorangium sp. So ce131 TaxID=3133282 RepID=UPI003F608A3E
MTDGAAARCAPGAARRPGAALAALAFAALALGLAPGASAQPLRDNQYAIDLFQGPILAPLRVTGIAGAYAAYAEGIAGMVANAAAPALREPFSTNWLEGDVAASISIPIELFENNDFDNSGDVDLDYSNFVYVTLGGQLQAGDFGLGVNAELQRYSVTPAADAGGRGAKTSVVIGKYHFLGGVRLLGDALALGAGARAVTLSVDADRTSLTKSGIAPELGLLVRPDWASYRLGATLRLPVNGGRLRGEGMTVDEAGVKRGGGLILPNEVVLPWELEVGLAVQVGPRPLNPAWLDPHEQERELRARIARRRAAREERRRRELAGIGDPGERAARARALAAERARELAADERELAAGPAVLKRERRARYWNWPREHLLITAELLVTGAVANGVSMARFLAQNERESDAGSAVGTSGAYVSFSPRFGIETEPLPGLVHTRFGSYYEPNRFGRVGRQHFTFGADLRVLSTTLWGVIPETAFTLQASMDFAPRYDSVSAGIGVWH